MNEQVIIAVANAITANAEVLKSLIDSLPKTTVEAVEKKVSKSTTKSTEVKPEPVVVAAPVAPVVVTPVDHVVVPTTPAMPAAPFPSVASIQQPIQQPIQTPVQPAPVVAPVVAAPIQADAPVFADAKQMMKFVMDSYQALGNVKGARIQEVLNSIGVHNINDVTPEQYGALFAGVEALKNG